MGLEEIVCLCVLKHTRPVILNEAHVSVAGVHYVEKAIVKNILQAGLWWPTMHADA